MRLEVATVIWRQIPIMTKMACGMRNPQAESENKLCVRVGGMLRFVEVTLDPRDTYTVDLIRYKRGSLQRVVVQSLSNVYCDMLGDIIYAMCNNKR